MHTFVSHGTVISFSLHSVRRSALSERVSSYEYAVSAGQQLKPTADLLGPMLKGLGGLRLPAGPQS
jgi:hypothetical protein